MFTIENEQVKVSIKQNGAELASYFDKESQREVVWSADPAHWKRHAPILFPIVGKVENNTYKIENQEFTLSQHGFARDNNFEVKHQSETSLLLEFSSNNETKKVYPFDFVLQVEFQLQEKELKVLYRVQNPTQERIYFCLGAHPGFNCPMKNGLQFSDYELAFEKPENSGRILLTPEGFRTGEKAENWLSTQTLQLSEELFKEDALVFDDLKSSYLTIQSSKGGDKVKVGWNNYPDMGLWKPLNNAPFICIEPWNGMADQAGLGNDFRDKKGVVTLEGAKSFECFYTIENFKE